MNEALGKAWELSFATILRNHGWWVYNTPHKIGQPADIIAVKKATAFLVDCKTCNGNKFAVSRIEPNQKMAMQYFQSRNKKGTAFFAMLGDNDVAYMVAYDDIKDIEKGSIDIAEYGLNLIQWLTNADELL